MTKNKKKLPEIVIAGYDVITTETAAKLVRDKLIQLKLTFKGPRPLENHELVVTVPPSPNGHKDAQEKYTRTTHRRKFSIVIPDNFIPSTLKNLLSLEMPGKVNLKFVLPSEKDKEMEK